MVNLFTPWKLRGVTFRNRIFVSPMCQYSSRDGLPTDWHLVHLGSRAVGGAGLVMVEATGVSPEGRISPWDSGIWSEAHVEAFKPITTFIRRNGAVSGMQLAHAGRKASTDVPWRGGGFLPASAGGWVPLASSPVPFNAGDPAPTELGMEGIRGVIREFEEAAGRALRAGFEVLEIHCAHGYLLHEFLSPLTNQRKDEYGGSIENRMRFPLEVAAAVRASWPGDKPLIVRISASDWVEGGWDLESSIVFSGRLKALGIDAIDCSSGGILPGLKIPLGPGYQVPFAEAIRKECSIPTIAVGLITEAVQAEEILASGRADAVMLARELLRDPYWPLHAARELGVEILWPDAYARAR